MGKTIYSDNTGVNGVNYATVGENIRNGAKNIRLEDLVPFLAEREKVLTALNANSENLRSCILFLLGVNTDAPWGDKYMTRASDEELQQIKRFLGIN